MNDPIKVLFITRDHKLFVDKNQYYMTEELKKHVDLMLWHKSGNINDILQELPKKPDIIVIHDPNELIRRVKIQGDLSSLGIPIVLIMIDLHLNRDFYVNFINKNNIRYILSTCRDSFYHYQPQFSDRMYWWPHYVNTNIFKDYGLKKDIDYLMIGAKNHGLYPLRAKIYNTLRDKPGFISYSHPGYGKNLSEEDQHIYVGEKYAREINRAKIFFTCDSRLKYPVLKYYEVPACRTLLLATENQEIMDLGFKPYVHFVPITKEDFEEKAEYYLKNEKERQRITDQGYEFVHQNFSLDKKAILFVSIIKEILKKETELSQ